MPKGKRILIVAAHPDDEVIGCGGTIALHSQKGDEVYIVYMADGVTSRYYDPDHRQTREEELSAHAKAIEHRAQESYRAALALGVAQTQVFHLTLADQRLDQYPLLDLIKRIERIKARLDPQMIYTHFGEDLNLDHRLTCQAVATAFRPKVDGSRVPILCFEVPETTQLSIPKGGGAFIPNHVEDISATMHKKKKALEIYESERCEYPHPRSWEFLKKLAAQRGMPQSIGFAEAFIKL